MIGSILFLMARPEEFLALSQADAENSADHHQDTCAGLDQEVHQLHDREPHQLNGNGVMFDANKDVVVESSDEIAAVVGWDMPGEWNVNPTGAGVIVGWLRGGQRVERSGDVG